MPNAKDIDLNDEDVFAGVDEAERLNQIKIFVTTARALYQADNIDVYTDEEIAKWLIGKGGHRGKALEALAETHQFKVNTILQEDFAKYEASGKLQFFGKAVDQSVIMVWTGSRHEIPKTPVELEKEVRFIIYMMEKGRREKIITDKITVIFDRTGMKTDKSDAKIAAQVIPMLQKHYPERLSRLYLFPTNSIFFMAWNMSKYFLDAATIPKLLLKESPVQLAEWVDREHYFRKYGGLAQDPFEIDTKLTTEPGSTVLKTAPLVEDTTKHIVQVEEFWSAPLEYQGI